MTELEHYITSYFGILSAEEMRHVVSVFQPSPLKKGDFYLKAGTNCDSLSFLQSGFVRIYASTKEGEVTQWISTKGYFITDLSSLVFQTPARWNIQALADSELYTIKRKEYSALGNHIPKWHELEKLFLAKCFTILEDRIFSHLSMSAEERNHHFFEHNKELFNHVPLHYIASMLGMTPETFSRIRKKNLF